MPETSTFIEPKFVGKSRKLLVEGLLLVFDQVRDTGTAVWVSLEAPPGAGKTRAVQEFYAELAAGKTRSRQSDPRYWPPSILGATDVDLSDLGARRKRVYPEHFDRPRQSLPSWMWWGIACSLRNGVPSFALVNDFGQLQRHETWWTAAWSRSAPIQSLGAKVLDLRDAATAWGKGTIEAKAVELAAQAAIGSVPFLGLFTKLATWTKDQAKEAWETHKEIAGASSIDAASPKDELLDDAVSMVRHLAVKGLPLVLFIEDLHLADELLIEFLVRIVTSDAAVMVVTTGWPGDLDDQHRREHRLWRGAPAEQMLRVKDDGAPAPSPFPEGAGLGPLGSEDLKAVVRAYFPHAEGRTLERLVERYRNPLELELVCLQPKYELDFPDGEMELSDAEIAQLPTEMRGIYDLIWTQLPKPVRWALAMAAIAQPAGIAGEVGAGDERWLPERLARAAATAFPKMPDIRDSLHGRARDYSWARVVDVMLRQFHEPVQREVAEGQALSLYSDVGRQKIYQALASEVLAEADDDATPPRVREHRARTILALNSVGSITDPRVVIEATLTLVKGLYPFPREYKRLLELVTRARRAVGDRLTSEGAGSIRHDAATRRLLAYEAVVIGDIGRAEEAIEASRALVEDMRKDLGADHRETFQMRNNLAYWLGTAGHLEEATKALRTLLDDQLRILDGDDEGALDTRSNLAYWTGESGHLREATDAFRKLLADQIRVLGPDHLDSLSTRRKLATTLAKAGQVEQATAELRALLDDQFRVRGPDNEETLRTRSDLAYLMRESGENDEAIEAFRAILDDQLRVLGPDHPNCFSTRGNLAMSMARAGQIDVAMDSLQTLLVDRLRVLGAYHPDTLRTRGSLAQLLARSGQIKQAIEAFRELLGDQERILGPNHPDTLSTRGLLAGALVQSGDIEEGIAASRALLDDQSQVLDPDHPETFSQRGIAAVGLSLLSESEQALATSQALLDDQTRVLGPDHPDTLTTRRIVALSLGQSGRIDEALAATREVLVDLMRVLGPDNPDTLVTRASLGIWLAQSGRIEQALEELRPVFNDQLRVLGPDDPATDMTRALIAGLQAMDADS